MRCEPQRFANVFNPFQNVVFYALSDDGEWVRTNLGNVTYYIGAEVPWEGQLVSEEDRVGKHFVINDWWLTLYNVTHPLIYILEPSPF